MIRSFALSNRVLPSLAVVLSICWGSPQAPAQITIDFTQMNPLVDGTSDPADFYQTTEVTNEDGSFDFSWDFTFDVAGDGTYTVSQSENDTAEIIDPNVGLLPDSAVTPGISGSPTGGFGDTFTLSFSGFRNGTLLFQLRLDGQDDDDEDLTPEGNGLGIQGANANAIESRATDSGDTSPERLAIFADNTDLFNAGIVLQELTLNHTGGTDTTPRLWDKTVNPFDEDAPTVTEAANAATVTLPTDDGFLFDFGQGSAIFLDGGDQPGDGEAAIIFTLTSITFDFVDFGSVNEIFGDINDDGLLDTGDVTSFAGAWKTDTSGFANNLLRHESGDLNYDGVTNFLDWAVLRDLLTAEGLSAAEVDAAFFSAIPEPTTLALGALAALALTGARRRD